MAEKVFQWEQDKANLAAELSYHAFVTALMGVATQVMAAFAHETPPPLPPSLGLLDKDRAAADGKATGESGIRYYTPGAPDAALTF